jgi:hypothetical protein
MIRLPSSRNDVTNLFWFVRNRHFVIDPDGVSVNLTVILSRADGCAAFVVFKAVKQCARSVAITFSEALSV